jgi:hypothetical protein
VSQLRATVRAHPHAFAVAGFTALFVAFTIWWVLVDQRLPGGGDPGRHLSSALGFGERLGDFDIGGLIGYRADATSQFFYPPVGRFVAGIAPALGLDVQDWGVVIVNLVFVPMLAFGTYLVGKLVYGPFAGMLAAAFALVTPMVLDLFHVFMLDAPLAATVAIALWAFLASDRFSKRRETVLAGALLGLAVMVKTTAPIFFVGPVLAMLAGGGWREWRNIALAGAAFLAIALPWHLIHIGDISSLTGQAPQGFAPSPLGGSGEVGEVGAGEDLFNRFTQYGWIAMNLQYFLPLMLLFGVGLVYAIREIRTRRHVPELLAGIAFAYLFFAFAISLRDPRYTLPLVVFVAVIGTGWIAATRLTWLRGAAVGLLAAAAVVNVFAVASDDAGTTRISPPGDDLNIGDRSYPGSFTVVNDEGYIGGPPRSDPFWVDMLDAARADGARTAKIRVREAPGFGTDYLGFLVLAREHGIREISVTDPERKPDLLIDTWVIPDSFWVDEQGLPEPCARILDGVPQSEMAVAVQRRVDGRYERWCDFVAGD